MNEQDKMKDDSTSQDAYANRYADGRGADGQGYTNPDGSHGYVYNTHSEKEENRSRRFRGAVIILSAVLVAAITVGGCCIGSMVALRNIRRMLETPSVDSGMSGEFDTMDGLIIAGGTDPLMPGETEPSTEESGEDVCQPETTDSTTEAVTVELIVTAPEDATIHKLPPKRTDVDQDGKADVAYDKNGNVLTSAGDACMSVATVVDKVAASVVEITTETIVQSGYIGQYVTSGAGSGVIIAEEGYIVTNHHVIDGANTITVRLNDGTEFPATLVGTDEQTDVAVLWIDAGDHPLRVATMGASYDLVVGEDILAIGNPLGSLGGTVTEGMISATAREINVSGTDMTLLQVSAPINPGNSGGGLFNLAGELIGVVNAKMSSEEIEGLGFAIPSDTAYTVICELINHGYVRGRPALGITLTEVSSWQGNRYVCVKSEGHELLKPNDLILTADGETITSIAELTTLVRRKSVGATIQLTVYRDNEKLTLDVPIVEYVPAK